MQVTIEQRKSSFTSEYDIQSPSGNFYARRKFFSLWGRIFLNSENGETLAQIDGTLSPVRSKHRFRFSDGRVYTFQCEKVWKRVFTCSGNGQTLVLYEHRGLKYSIFQNDQQIAAILKNRFVWGSGNRYDIRLNSEADLPLVLCMILTINSIENYTGNSGATIDLGNIGPQARPYDESWEPS